MSLMPEFLHYTAEKVPVRTLYVGNLAGNVTEIDLREHFDNFGEITKVVTKIRNRNRHSYAFITYSNIEGASRALNTSQHILNDIPIRVRRADSWHQPALIEYVKKPVIDYSVSSSNIPRDSILSLNDDCLLHLFSYLNLPDQVKLSESCSRLAAIGEIVFRKMKQISFSEIGYDTLIEARDIIAKIGKNLDHIYFCGLDLEGSFRRCAEFFPPLCPNLKELSFVTINVNLNTYRKLAPVLKELDSLVLRNCGVTDNILTTLQCCSKLTKLDLSENYELSGKGLNTLSNTILDLNLNNCSNIQPSHFIKLCKVAKFKKLNINRCFRLNVDAFEHLTKVESLEEIHLSTNLCTADLRPIAKIPNLKDLSIRCFKHLDDKFYEELSREKSDILQRFNLVGGCMNDFKKEVICNLNNLKDLCIARETDDDLLARLINRNTSITHLNVTASQKISVAGLLKFVEKSKDIQRLDITSCRQFDKEFVVKLIDTLKKSQRPRCLELMVGNTLINPSFEEEPMYKECKHLLKLSHDISYLDVCFEDDDDYVSEDDEDNFSLAYDDYSDNSDYNDYDNDDDDHLDFMLNHFVDFTSNDNEETSIFSPLNPNAVVNEWCYENL